jgi:urease accessory protein
MIRLTSRLQPKELPDASIAGNLLLTFDDRKRGRLSTLTADGEAVGIFLERGKVLADQDRLLAEDGRVYRIHAAAEPVVEATTDDWLAFAKVCYHLGNRHVPLQIGERWLRFQPDHVLQELAELHGLQTRHAMRPFEPESGAYGGHSHGHASQGQRSFTILSIDP